MLALALILGFGEFNPKLSIGDAAPTWADLEGIDGQKHSLAEWKGKDVLIVAFLANSCATVEAYEPRMIAFVDKHCGKDANAAFVAIGVNLIKDDLLPKMKERAEKRKYNFPYLHDPSQEVAKAYGARFTPEFFVLNKDRKVVYMGSFDDKSKAEDVKAKYLEPAVAAVLKGAKVEKAETVPFGCKIRFAMPKE